MDYSANLLASASSIDWLTPCIFVWTEFDAGGYKFSCKVFFAPQFAQVRQNCIDPEDFVESLARCVKWNTSGGKSGSAFLKTRGTLPTWYFSPEVR